MDSKLQSENADYEQGKSKDLKNQSTYDDGLTSLCLFDDLTAWHDGTCSLCGKADYINQDEQFGDPAQAYKGYLLSFESSRDSTETHINSGGEEWWGHKDE